MVQSAVKYRQSTVQTAPRTESVLPAEIPEPRDLLLDDGTFAGAQRRKLAKLACGNHPTLARRARILLLSDKGYSDSEVAEIAGVHKTTVWRLRKRVRERGLEAALVGARRKKLGKEQRAYLLALSRSEPPERRTRWTMQLLADTLVERGMIEDISHVTVWKVLRRGACDGGAA